MYRGVNDHFLDHPWAREQKHDNGPVQGQLLFLGQVPFYLSTQSFDFSTVFKMASLRIFFLSVFWIGRLLQVAKTEYDEMSFNVWFTRTFYACISCLLFRIFLHYISRRGPKTLDEG